MKTHVLATAALFIWIVPAALAQEQSPVNGVSESRSQTPTTLAILNERVAAVAFHDTPFDQAIEWLADLTPMNITVRWELLDYAGVERDKPIDLQARGLRISQLLWLLLNEAGGPDLRLAYWTDGEFLVISTEADLDRNMVVRVYPVSDLLLPIPQFSDGPRVALDATGSGGQNAIFTTGASQSGNDDRENEDHGKTDIDHLVDLIVETVQPDSWVKYGGRGTIHAYRELLVVRNNLRVHQALGGWVRVER